MPIYLFAALLYDIAHIIIGGQSLIKTLLLAPIEAVGLQSFYTSLFSQSHNGGTWFISCILFCYLLFPFLHLLLTQFSKKAKVIILLALVSVLLYSPIICYIFDLSSIYSNPLFRCMEFMIGIILASFKVDYGDSKLLKIIYNHKTVVCVSLVMVFMISIAVKLGIAVGNAMLYNWICLPCFSIIVLGLSGLEFDKIKESKIVKQLSAISYVFFLAQLFSNDICKFVIKYFSINSNIIKILLGWIVCVVVAMVLRICELVINKHIRVRFFIDDK